MKNTVRILSLAFLSVTTAIAGLNNDRYEKSITVAGDSDTYYPVVISLPNDGMIYDLYIGRHYQAPAPSTWYTASHKGGLAFHVKLASTSWSGNPTVFDVVKNEYTFVPQVADYGYTRHGYQAVVWLRGGGALYQLTGTIPDILDPDVYYETTQTYDHSNDAHDQYVSPMTTVNVGKVDYGDLLYSKDGNLGIGAVDPQNKLDVNGTIRAKEVIVESGWADYVFADDYQLVPLSEVEAHISENGHLPGIPSAEEIQRNGLSVAASQTLMMQKIEELTLYTIEQEKRLDEKDRQIADLIEANRRILESLESKP